MRIAIVGTGYVGLVSAACFAELGHEVIGVDIDEKKVEMLTKGKSPIYEPGLEELIQKNLKTKRLMFTTDLRQALPKIQILFTAVPTPIGADAKADLKAVFSVADLVAKHVNHDLLFVNKSTVPVGTGKLCEERIAKILKQRKVKAHVPVISNPEFLREGMAVTDTLMPERIVVGINGNHSVDSDEWVVDSKKKKTTHYPLSTTHSRELMEDLYRPITRVGKPLVFMSRESAEIVKYASNAFLATKISFINMIAELAEKTGGDVRDIAKGMGLDSRIGPRFLHAGIGYGGSCFPKDTQALVATGDEHGVDMAIVSAAERANRRSRSRFIEKILSAVPAKSTLAVWGLSFKPKTDDMRDAPSLDIVPALLARGHDVVAFDPAAMAPAQKLFRGITFARSALDALKNADALIVLTEWDEFRGIDMKALKKTMKGSLLFDGRNVYEPKEVEAAGMKYFGVGIGN